MTNNSWKRIALVSLFGGLLIGCGASNPVKQELSAKAMANPVLVERVTPYRKGVVVPNAVRTECKIQSQLPDFIEAYASERGIAVVKKPKAVAKKGRVLQLDIINLVGTAGGAWSGAKSVTVEGKLFENGKMKGSFTATRFSGGGFMGGYKGTCSILGRCVKALGQDIANWLQAPTMNARLGDGA